MDKKRLDLYSDYLLSSFGATTATGLWSLLDGQISHDQVTRFLSQAEYTSKELWHQVKTCPPKRGNSTELLQEILAQS